MDWSGDRPRSDIDFVGQPLYFDILEDAARLFFLGLPAGGLTNQILMSRPFEELRANCHSLVDDQTLRNTVEFLHARVSTVVSGNTAYLKADRFLEKVSRNASFTAARDLSLKKPFIIKKTKDSPLVNEQGLVA